MLWLCHSSSSALAVYIPFCVLQETHLEFVSPWNKVPFKEFVAKHGAPLGDIRIRACESFNWLHSQQLIVNYYFAKNIYIRLSKFLF